MTADIPTPNVFDGWTVARCHPAEAVALNAQWHSRLPHAQKGPWRATFIAKNANELPMAVGLWHNTSARGLPKDWLELRRYAISPDAPKNTATWALARMQKLIASDFPEIVRLISYQDLDAHQGTIYRAANWTPAYFSRPRNRDRSTHRVGTQRQYRSDANGDAPASAGKIRWEMSMVGEAIDPLAFIPTPGEATR